MKKTLLSLALLVLCLTPSFGADEWLKGRPASTDQKIDWPAASQANNAAVDRLLANYREGLTLAYSSATTVSVSSGEVVCSNAAGTIRKFRQNTSSTNVTFSDLDTGSEASSTTYYLYAVCDADATTATFKVSASSTAPTGVTYYKRLGSFYNDASSNITYSGIANDNNYYSNFVGDRSSKSSGVPYQATTDGTVEATCFNNGAVYSYGYTDSNATPITEVAKCGVDTGSNIECPFSFKVKRGNYYKATCGTTTRYINWIPSN